MGKGPVSRRTWLGGVGSVCLGSIAGCLNLQEESRAEQTPEEDTSPSETTPTATSDGPSTWTFRADGPLASPAIGDELVFVGSVDRTLYAIDRETGETVWTVESDSRVGSPRVVEGSVYVNTNGELLEIEPASGTITARMEDSGFARVTGDIVIGSTNDGLVAYDSVGGRRLWTSDTTTGYGRTNRPVIGDDVVVFKTVDNYVDDPDAERDKDTRVFCVDRETGEQKWYLSREEFVGHSLGVAYDIYDDVILLSLDDGTLWGVTTDTGEVQWEQTIQRAGSSNTAPQPVTFGEYFVLATKNIYGIDPTSGSILWAKDRDLPHVTQRPSIVDGTAYFPTGGFFEHSGLVGIGTDRGTEVEVEFPETFEMMPAVGDGEIYVSHTDATLRGYHDWEAIA